MPNILVFLPTYNERSNLEYLLTQFRRLPLPGITLLIVDDNSRDGTFEFLSRKHALPFDLKFVRQSQPGRGMAGREALRWALENGADYLAEMDADGSHDPFDIPRLLEPLLSGQADVVLGSRRRYHESSPLRRAITFLSNTYTRVFLDLPFRDCNSGFRIFNRRALETLAAHGLTARKTDIVHEILFVCQRRGLRIKEIPVVFYPRRHGHSTKTYRDFVRVFMTTLRLRFTRLRGRTSQRQNTDPFPETNGQSPEPRSRSAPIRF